MPSYEHVFLARQDVSTQQAETMMKDYQALIEAGGGKVTKSEYWGLKPLAYKIKKSRKAHYALFNIEGPHPAVAEMERQMSISPDILRFLTIKVETLETEPSAMMRKGDRDRDERGGRGGFGGGRGGREGGGFRGGRDDFRGGGGGGRSRDDGDGRGGSRGREEGGRDDFRGGRGRDDARPPRARDDAPAGAGSRETE